MSCCDDNLYKQSCCPDTPYPTVQHESVPSLIDNLVSALYGEISKTVSGGRVVWNIPCDPSSSPTEVPTIPREEGEGLLCYLMRIFQNTVGQYSPFQYWSYVGNGSTTFSLSPSVNTLRSSYLVYLNGVVQPPTAYTISNTNPVNIVFTIPPANGVAITVVNLGYQPPGVLQDVTQSDATPTNSSQTQTVGDWLAYLIAQLATKLTTPTIPSSGSWQLGSLNGVVQWQQFALLPPNPTGAGQKLLTAPGLGGNPSWQDAPVIAVGPITATGSTTPRYLSDRFAEVVNVADFGAVGDWNGVTGTDDRAAIQAAVNYALTKTRACVTFEAGKTYLLDSSTVPSDISAITVSGGTNDTELTFRGNGARLWIQRNNVSSLCNFFRVLSRGKRFIWEDITFERSAVRLPANFTSQENNGAIFMSPVATDRIEVVGCYKVNFINTFSLSVKNFTQQTVSWIDTYNKVNLVEITDCKFLYPYGSNSLNPFGGGQIINLSTWVKVAKYTGCFIDGAYGGKIPNDVLWPKDGFNYVNATINILDSCHFQNLWVEAIIAQSDGDPAVAAFQDFVVPAVGGNVTIALGQYNVGINTLVAGDQLVIMPADLYLNTDAPVGIYQVVTPPANWNTGTTMVVQRIADNNLPFSSPVWSLGPRQTGAKVTTKFVQVAATNNTGSINGTYYYDGDVFSRPSFILGDFQAGYTPVSGTKLQFSSVNNRWEIVTGGTVVRYYSNNTGLTVPTSGWTDGSTGTASVAYAENIIRAYLHKNAREARFVISNCTFDGPQGGITKLNGTGGPFNISPGVLAKCPTTITGCSFAGHYAALSCGPQYATTKCGPFIVTNNYFYGKQPNAAVGGYLGPNAGYLLGDKSVFANNIIFQNTTKDYATGILCGGDGTQICNNTWIVGTPDPGSTASPSLPTAIATYGTRNSQRWNMSVDNNTISGWNYGVGSGGMPLLVGRLRGSATGAMINPFHVGPNGITTGFDFVTGNGTRWFMELTNDGEIQLRTI